MKFMHGEKCLAKWPAYDASYSAAIKHYCGPNPHFKAEEKNCITQTFSFCSHHQRLLPLHSFLFSDSLVIWWQNWTLGALDLHCSYANDSNEKTAFAQRLVGGEQSEGLASLGPHRKAFMKVFQD